MSAPACAHATWAAGDDPAGSATPFDLLVLLEVAPPWPRIALHDERVPASVRSVLADAARSGTVGAALLVDDGGAPAAGVGVAVWRRRAPASAPQPSPAYAGWTARCAPEALADVLRSLLADRPPPAARPAPPTWLVCTHGERDACCGRWGEPLVLAARDRLRDGVRVVRTSHFGGHRFAPTLLALPDGRMWAHVDADALEALAGGSFPDPTRHYRGWCAVPTWAQAAERDRLAAHGQAWRDAEVACTPEGPRDAAGTPAAVAFAASGALAGRWRATLHRTTGPAVPASCGGPSEPRRHVRATWVRPAAR